MINENNQYDSAKDEKRTSNITTMKENGTKKEKTKKIYGELDYTIVAGQ